MHKGGAGRMAAGAWAVAAASASGTAPSQPRTRYGEVMLCHEAMEQDRSDKAPVWAEAAAQAAEAAAWAPAARDADAWGVRWPPDRVARASAPSAERRFPTRAACHVPKPCAPSAAPP